MEQSDIKKIELEILTCSYWEHFKAAKDLALSFPPEHAKRKKIEETLQEIQKKLDALKVIS